MSTRVEVVYDNTFKIRAGYERAVEKAIRKACLDTEATAKRNVRDQDAIDTGALLNSIYADTRGMHHYQQAQASARAEAAKGSRKARRSRKAKPKTFEPLPEVRAGAMEGIVAVGAEYGINVELGTAHRAPRPFMGPAADEVGAEFDKNCAHMIDKEIGR